MIFAAAMIQAAAIAAAPHHNQSISDQCKCEAQKQAHQKKMSIEERHANMTKFVVDMLKLDEKTAAKFTPIYKDYLKEKSDLRHEGMKNRRPQKGNVTDAEAQKIVKERLSASKKLLGVREKYYNKMAKVITPTQLLKIYDMEQNFDNKMRNAWGNRTNGRHQGAHHSGLHKPRRTAPQNKSRK